MYSRIDYKVLAHVVGHTYRPTDRDLVPLRSIYIKLRMCTPEVWYHHVRDSSATADSKVEIEMQQENFHDHHSYLHNLYTEQNKDASGRPLEFSKVLWFNFGVGEELVNGTLEMKEYFDEVWVRYTHDLLEIPGLCVTPFLYICEY